MQAHDDLVNSDFLHQPAKHFLNAITILLSKITYCEYKCLKKLYGGFGLHKLIVVLH